MKGRLKLGICLIWLAILCSIPNIIEAKVTGSVVPGIDSFSRYDEWFPISVFAKSDESADGSLTLNCYGPVRNKYKISIPLGQQSNFARTYYFQPTMQYSPISYCDYEFSADGASLAKGHLGGNTVSAYDYL